jgi:hypothetical protein
VIDRRRYIDGWKGGGCLVFYGCAGRGHIIADITLQRALEFWRGQNPPKIGGTVDLMMASLAFVIFRC